MKKSIIVLCTVLICYAFKTDLQKKTVRQKGFDIECFVSTKKDNKNFKPHRMYYWYKSGEVHHSMSSSGGFLLHGSFSKYHKSNQLVEQGNFNYGLKNGVWKVWHDNGVLKQYEEWQNGLKAGSCKTFDTDGSLTVSGKYRNNVKVGRWIDYRIKDTTYHQRDTIYTKRPRGPIHEFLRKKDSLEKAQIKQIKLIESSADSLRRAKIKSKKRYLKKQDSITRTKKKLKRQLEREQDSIKRANKKAEKAATLKSKEKNLGEGFFKKLFKKER